MIDAKPELRQVQVQERTSSLPPYSREAHLGINQFGWLLHKQIMSENGFIVLGLKYNYFFVTLFKR